MKDLVKKAESFITFSMPLHTEFIRIEFEAVHNRWQKDIPAWNINCTTKKLMAAYWLSHVSKHCLFVVGLSSLLMFVFNHPPILFFLSGMFIAVLIVAPVLCAFHYWPAYVADFLPKLEMVKEAFKATQNEQLEKCRQAQLSNFALTLVYYAFDKTSGINSLLCNDQTAGLLTKLYGVDQGSMKKNLELILGKKRLLPPRKYTEIHNRFDEACAFLEELQFPGGVQILQELRLKFQH